jgi:hypothetical protein
MMAKRLLLTLLALLGLATQLAPAQARVGAGASSAVGAVMLAAAEDTAAVARSGPLHRPTDAPRLVLEAATPNLAVSAPLAPPVRTRIDRARE